MIDQNKNIILIGMPGVGKTTIGKLLAQKLGREFVDMDDYLEQKVSMSIPEMFAISEEFFRAQESEATKELAARDNLVIATGGGVIKIAANMELLQDGGVVFFLNRSVDDILCSLNAEYRPLVKDNPRERMEQLYFERYDRYLACANHKIDCSLNKLDITVQQIIAVLSAVDN